ncbi:MAG: 1-deoxy-D-xylulose-5-phosphate synthase [Burkholderiales bacterium]|jgi:1-deoxy-D-xylulose-5-phosphate synthase|nr:1-deoxy-D-xylulose-5-phosphate synthase [Burkholderiales bacterium]
MTNDAPAKLLDKIITPDDLRALPRHDLPALCHELRDTVIQTVSQTGGHLSSNLGVIELTVALHYVFNTPDDRIIWDVGHQTYAHKALTGRRDRLKTLRQKGGLSGFPSRAESPYDAFGTAHSSTSVSAALGMAVAAKLTDDPKKRSIVAVIGDGAMTAGMAFEALNNAGAMNANLLVILNDNEMSISKPVGAFHNHLTRILTSPLYNTVRDSGKEMLSKIPPMKRLVRLMEEHTKGMLMPGTLFEEFGFFYVGPVDGHNVETLARTLANVREMKGPVLLHVVTRKGKGYEPAEKDPVLYHGVSKFDPIVGIQPHQDAQETYSDLFGRWLVDQARVDDKLVAVTPAMCEGSGMNTFAHAFPDRYFDVGIAEQHAVTFAAGMACDGQKPVVAIYSTFLQRAYDQLIHDVALQNLPVMFAVDRAGIVGADGATHIGAFDLSFLRCVPNLTIMTPADKAECYAMLSTAYRMNSPALVRYPRGVAKSDEKDEPFDLEKTLPIGRGVIQREGHGGVAILVFGTLLSEAHTAAETLDATVVNMRFVSPLDTDLILKMAQTHRLLVTVEENVVAGGAGSAVAEALSLNKVTIPLLHLGLPNRFIEHGAQDVLRQDCGLDAAGMIRQIQARLKPSSTS